MSVSARRLINVSVDRLRWPRPESLGHASTKREIAKPMASAGQRARLLETNPSPTPESAERLNAVERDAFAKGYAEGERSGELAAAKRNEAMLRRLVATVEEIASVRAGMMRKTERELVRLAVAMAERIVRREVDADAELLAGMARGAIDRLGQDVAATIHLNPEDYEAMMKARQGAPVDGAVQLIPDPQIGRGGCLVKSAFGTVDAGIDTQVREMSHALLGDDADAEKTAKANGAATTA
jgi:flagellar assembly protein FliH